MNVVLKGLVIFFILNALRFLNERMIHPRWNSIYCILPQWGLYLRILLWHNRVIMCLAILAWSLWSFNQAYLVAWQPHSLIPLVTLVKLRRDAGAAGIQIMKLCLKILACDRELLVDHMLGGGMRLRKQPPLLLTLVCHNYIVCTL